MKKWLILAAIMTTGLAHAQYGAQGTKVDAVLAMAQRYGSAELQGPAGDWSIDGEMDDLKYTIYFDGCNTGTRLCQSMYMLTSWEGTADPEAINAWNADTFGGKGYLDEDGFPYVELWASLKGVSRDYLGDVFDNWQSITLLFESDVLDSDSGQGSSKDIRG